MYLWRLLKSMIVPFFRVASERHYVEDVLAGAALGTASSWYLTSENHDLKVTPLYSRGFFGMEFRADF